MRFRGRRPERWSVVERFVGSSVKSLCVENDKVFFLTREVWGTRLERDLSREDAREIVENTTGFFTLLAEWSRAERRLRADSIRKPNASNLKEARDDR